MTDSTERFHHCALLPPKNYSRAAFVGENIKLVDGLKKRVALKDQNLQSFPIYGIIVPCFP